ncbi:acyl-CoA thioesterase [Hansschlegelia plantiphila]|uniref:Thioesterase n=1 Tax=Hansschlegelia plantiphila TaxID=374655 RepID=A0A9W6IZC5_9HYPH|nr:thioesterase family protein [Hansschlegelia plantiphila]GLK67965.1 thioesterase [Hansschlegelia plantiphila]
MADAFVSPPLAIEQAFLDHNGHVNMAYHLVLVDRALDLAFEPLKGPNYLAGRGMTTFAGEVHVRYLREVNAEDEVRGRVILVESDAKRALWAVEIIRASDGAVVTTAEGVSLSVSAESRRVAPFPDDVRARIEAVVARDAEAAAGLDWLGRRVSMRRG